MASQRINPIFFPRFGVGRKPAINLNNIQPSMSTGTVEDVFWREYDMPPARHMAYVEKPTSTYAQKALWTFLFCSLVASCVYIGFRSSQIHWPALIAALSGQPLETKQPSTQPPPALSTFTPAAYQESALKQAITTTEQATYPTPLPPRYGHSSETLSPTLISSSDDDLHQVANEEPISVELVAYVGKTVPQKNMQDDTVTLERSDKSNSLGLKIR